MTPSINKKTQAFLASIEQASDEQAIDFFDEKDPIDRLIHKEGLRIKSVFFERDLDLMLVVLTNKTVIEVPLTDYPSLSKATDNELNSFKNEGVGLHWPHLDEDLSLRGFLENKMLQSVMTTSIAA